MAARPAGSLPDVCTLSVRVQPRASRDELVGWREDTLVIRLAAPPVDGEANKACCRFIADLLDTAPSRVTLVAGGRSRVKRLRVDGLTDSAVREKIEAQLQGRKQGGHVGRSES